jgi:hypothetical protein
VDSDTGRAVLGRQAECMGADLGPAGNDERAKVFGKFALFTRVPPRGAHQSARPDNNAYGSMRQLGSGAPQRRTVAAGRFQASSASTLRAVGALVVFNSFYTGEGRNLQKQSYALVIGGRVNDIPQVSSTTLSEESMTFMLFLNAKCLAQNMVNVRIGKNSIAEWFTAMLYHGIKVRPNPTRNTNYTG